jgi:hypothetical protein
MMVIRSNLRMRVLTGSAASLYFGVIQGEWAETMFNATLL